MQSPVYIRDPTLQDLTTHESMWLWSAGLTKCCSLLWSFHLSAHQSPGAHPPLEFA